MNLEQIATQFPHAAGYLNTASIGLPPQRAVDALQLAIDKWQTGKAEAPEYDAVVTAARTSFASLLSARVENVAVGAQVSALVALAATCLRPGSRVLIPDGEFTSVIFPFLVRDDLGLRVESVPLMRLADSIGADTDLVAFSSVQSSSGEVADLGAIGAAAAANDVITMCDATQSAGWLPMNATDYDFVIAGAYKWLLSPRGTAFMTVSDTVLERTRPLFAGWYSGESVWESIYGLPLRLAPDARRLDLSPGWLAWVGTAPALEVLTQVGVEAIHSHNVGLANTLLSELDLPPSNSAIVSLDLDATFDQERLSGLSTAYRAGRLRVGFHLYNSLEDVARIVAAIKG
ncbi:MAG: aminotransferase class V-fold PLP-dependent enzyme [bacterium]|nr:aminotransferase class V-fold PLP-dependent enzyme [bacterium]